ncbi:putative cytosolic protein [Granulibacter bethesdensis]|uniref:Cytosolic protein n=2 Tax=Granulibacter bethesdensis TaxID=364410 RepID=A0AAC9K7B7_9PROT|nr:putative cytosolic protein [Granulibacter bethesdensis]APH61865.1 putative cytosolic protein [Granulibacter bethesdensis]
MCIVCVLHFRLKVSIPPIYGKDCATRLSFVMPFEKPRIFKSMHFLPTERIALFIDGANLYSASRNLGFEVDYRNLLSTFRSRSQLVRAYYYSAVLETEEYSPLKPLTDWLAYNGYNLVTKPAREFTDASGRRRIKGNMDIELAVDMMEIADRIDHAVLFSGDADFRRVVEAVQRKGVRVSVVSSIRTSPPMIADDLRRQADEFLELADIATFFTRRQMEPRARAATRSSSNGNEERS